MRPGEKLHETLLTIEETEFAEYEDGENGYFLLHPTTDKRFEVDDPPLPYTSEFARELTREKLAELLKE